MKRFTYLIVLLFFLFNNCGKRLDKIPNDFIGNFYEKTGKEYWVYGVQSNFFINNCQFWNYQKIKSDKCKLSFWLTNKDSTKRIDIIKTDSLNFDFFENDKIIHCTKKADSIKRIAKNNPFSMDAGSVIIKGYIKNATKFAKTDSKIEFIISNEVVSDSKIEFAEIDSLDRFEINLKLIHSTSCLVKYRNNLKQLFVSPGDQLLFSSTDNLDEFDFMGTHSDVCYDIMNTEETNWAFETPKQYNAAFGKDPSEFKNYRDSIQLEREKYIQQYVNKNSCSDIFRIWSTKNGQSQYYQELMRYSQARFGKGSDKPMTYMDPYFSFIDSIDLNDSLAAICYNYLLSSHQLSNILDQRDGVYPTIENKEAYESIRINKRKELVNKYPQYSEDEINTELLKFVINRQINVILSKEYTRFRDLRLTSLLSQLIKGRHYNIIDYMYNRIKPEIRNKLYLNTLTQYYSDFKEKEEAFKNTPISIMKSSDKGEVLLKEIVQKHKNRVLIIDFWFTGCGACRSDFERMNKFKKDIVSEDVDFVYLCYSSSENDWKNVLKDYNIKGDNYLLSTNQFSDIAKMFDINSAPRYILINKAGRIVNSNFRPPMDSIGFLNALMNNLIN